jgi:hypothetical protein
MFEDWYFEDWAIAVTIVVVIAGFVVWVNEIRKHENSLKALRAKVHSLHGKGGLSVSEVISLLGIPQARESHESGDEFLTWWLDSGTVDFRTETTSRLQDNPSQSSSMMSGSFRQYYSATLRFNEGQLIEVYKEESSGIS